MPKKEKETCPWETLGASIITMYMSLLCKICNPQYMPLLFFSFFFFQFCSLPMNETLDLESLCPVALSELAYENMFYLSCFSVSSLNTTKLWSACHLMCCALSYLRCFVVSSCYSIAYAYSFWTFDCSEVDLWQLRHKNGITGGVMWLKG